MNVTKLRLVQNDPNHIETKLSHMKNLSQQIKLLQAEFDMEKKQIIADFFSVNEEYVTAKGLTLATYKEQIRCQFQGSKFKKENAHLYDKYCEPQAVNVFLLK